MITLLTSAVLWTIIGWTVLIHRKVKHGEKISLVTPPIIFGMSLYLCSLVSAVLIIALIIHYLP